MEQGAAYLGPIFARDPAEQQIGVQGPRAAIGEEHRDRRPTDPRGLIIQDVSRGVDRPGAIESGHSEQGGVADGLGLVRQEWLEKEDVICTSCFRQPHHVPLRWSFGDRDPVALGGISAKTTEPVLRDGPHDPGTILKVG